MAVDIDSLQIEIEATSSDAAAKIDALATALTNLKAAAKGGAGLTTVSKQMQALASAAASLNNTGIGKLRKIAPALNALSSVQKSSGLSSTVNALSKLSSVSESLKGNSIKEFASQMNQVASAMRPLATEMQKVSNGFSAFPIRIQKIIQSNTGLSASNNKAAKSFGVLGTGISSTTAKLGIYYLAFQRVANMASDWIKSANDYIENVNLFQVSMGEFYDEAFAYAELLNDRLGIDPSEWMRAQGVFMSMANGFGLARQQAYDLSEGLTELAYDLSSLYNEDVSESILRLQSALSGEIEPIRRLGISISQATLQEYALAHGIDESVISMTEQEKALLRSLVLMEGAGRIGAIGDFAKTLESPANALRVLRQQITQLGRAIGTALLPIIIQIIPWVVGLGLTLTVMSIIAQIKDGLNLGNTMLNAIGGALAGGALGGYFAFRRNLNPAQGVIGGLTAGIGISLLISSIISIAKDGLNIVNGIMGAIGGALAGFGIGMIFGGGAGAAIGLVIGVGVSLVIEGITAQIGGGAPSLSGGLMTILGSALAGAGIGSLVPVVGTAAGAVIGFGVGVVLEIIGIKEAAKVAYEASEDFQIMQDILDRCTDASSRTSSAMDSLKNEIADLDATVANYGIARQLADDIFDINENANASAYELQQMAVKVDVLNGLNISGLRLSIDETNGRVIETRASVEQLIESLEQEARYEAMRDILVQTYKDQYQAMLDVKQATQDYNAANEALMNTTQELNDTPWYNLSRREELKLAQEKETEALEAANRVREEANELIDISWGKSENLIQMMLELKESEAGIGDGTVEGLVNARAEMDDFLDEYKQSSKWSSIGEGIGTGVSNGIAKKKSAIRGALDSALSGMKSIFSSSSPQKKSGRIFSEMPEVKTINLNAYATGGFPNYGEMFIAREQGPELVGRIGNRTAVANNDQIVEGVAAGVTSANNGVINAIYAMAQQIIAAIEENGGDVYLDGDKVGKQVTAYQNRQNRMYGKTLQRI